MFLKDISHDNTDTIILHSPPHSIQAQILSRLLKMKGIRVVTVFWGSDIMRLTNNKSRNLEEIIKVSDAVNLSTVSMKEAFRVFYGSRYDYMISDAKFGSLAFENIKDLNITADECKNIFNLNVSKTVVAVGHNGKKEQQHIPVIMNLMMLDDRTKSRIQLLLHLGHGYNSKYTEEIKNILEKSGIEYTIITEKLPLDEIAKLRKATDILIHAQTTDAMSGAVREAIYAGTYIMNPSWINYKEFDDLGIRYIKYKKIDEISEKVKAILDGRL